MPEDSILDVVKKFDERSDAEVISLAHPEGPSESITLLSLPNAGGRDLYSVKKYVDEYRTRPESRAGTSIHVTLESFIQHVNRFKDEDSVIYADPRIGGKLAEHLSKLAPSLGDKSLPETQRPTLTAVIDYHHAGPEGEGLPRFGKHRAVHELSLSLQFRLWIAMNGELQKQTDFAEFIEDRISDLLLPDPALLKNAGPTTADAGGDFGAKTPEEQLADLARLLGGRFATPAEMMTLSRELDIRSDCRASSKIDLAGGKRNLMFAEDHTQGNGEAFDPPKAFLLGIPVFHGGPIYTVPARLRYRIGGSSVMWAFELYRIDRVFDHAFDEACTKAKAETELPVFQGVPE